MKKTLLILVALLAVSFTYAQKKPPQKQSSQQESNKKKFTATFKDGTTIDYEIVEDHTDKMHQWIVGLPFMGSRYYGAIGLPLFSLSYFSPDKFFVQAEEGGGFGLLPFEFYVHGLYFIKSNEKPSKVNLILKSSYVGNNTTMKYYSKADLTRKTYIGIHGGYAFRQYGTGIGVLQSHELVVGMGLLRGKFVKWVIATPKKPVALRGNTQLNLYGDVVLYPVRTLKYDEDATTEEKAKKASDVSTPIGFRVYLEQRASVAGRRDWGLLITLGGGYSTVKKLYPVAGLGWYAGF